MARKQIYKTSKNAYPAPYLALRSAVRGFSKSLQKGLALEEVEFHTAIVEDQYVIAQANVALDEKRRFRDEIVSARQGGDFILSQSDKVATWMFRQSSLLALPHP